MGDFNTQGMRNIVAATVFQAMKDYVNLSIKSKKYHLSGPEHWALFTAKEFIYSDSIMFFTEIDPGKIQKSAENYIAKGERLHWGK